MQESKNMNQTHCNQCPRQCPVDSLRCGRGRQYFAQMQEGLENGVTYEDHHEGHHDGHHHEGHHEHHGCKGKHNHREHGEGHHDFEHGRKGCPHKHRHFHEDMAQDELSALLSRCGHFLYHRSGRGHGQGHILKILASKETMTQKELQEQLQIQPGSMSEIISKLESRGMLTRTREEEDKRKVVLEITQQGKEQVEQHKNQNKNSDLYQALNEQEQEQLKTLLKKLLESWQ